MVTTALLSWSIPLLFWTLSLVGAQNETSYNPACLLSQRQNQTFTGGGFVISPRPSDEVTFLASGGWSPSTDARASTLRLGNDTVVPVFWLQATSLSSPGALVEFFDSRFELCVTFVTPNILSPSVTSCSAGSPSTPGQFRFQGILLPSGNWVFSPVSLTFSPLGVVVPLSATQSPQLCCLNVSAPQLLATDHPTLLRFSPRLSSPQGVWYSGKQVCFALGSSLPPFTVEAVHLSNDTVGGSSLPAEPQVAVAGSNWVFSVALVSSVVGGNTTVVASMVVSAGSKLTATFSNLALGSGPAVASAVVVVEAKQILASPSPGDVAAAAASNSAVTLNSLTLYPRVVLEGSLACALGFGQHRGSGTLTAYFGRWGAPTAPVTELPVLALLALDGTNSIATSVTTTRAQESVSVSVVDENGADRSALLWGHSRSRVLADGMAIFDGLSFASTNVSALSSPTEHTAGLLLWLRFTLIRLDRSAGGRELAATTMPIRLLSGVGLVAGSSALPAVARLMRVAPGHTQFTTDGVLVPSVPRQSLGPAAVVLQDARGLFLQSNLSSMGIEVTVVAQATYCRGNPLPPKKSIVDNLNVFCAADTSTVTVVETATADSTGVALFPSLTMPSFSGLVAPTHYIALQFVVQTAALPTSFIHGFTLSVFVRVSGSQSACFGLGFLSGVRLKSFYSADYQSRTAVAGLPLPPVVVALFDASGSLYTAGNESVSLAVSCASCTLSSAQTTFRNGFFVFPGIIATATTDNAGSANVRLRFVFSGNATTFDIQQVAVQELQSGPLALVFPSSASSALAVQFASSNSSFIGDDDSVVSVYNGSSVPPFVVDVVRFDGLLAGVVQTVSTPLPDYADEFSLGTIVCNISDPVSASGSSIMSVSASVNGGRAAFALPSLNARAQRLSLRCCLVPDSVAKSCTKQVWVRVLPFPSAAIAVQSSSSVTLSSTPYPVGTSLASSWVAGSVLSLSFVDLLVTAYCEAPSSRTLTVCTSVGGINVTAQFATLVDTLTQPATAASTTSMENGFAALTFSLPRDNDTPPDALAFSVATFAPPFANSSESSWGVASATGHYAIQPTPLSVVQRLAVTAYVPPQNLDPFVLQIRLSLKLQTEPNRLLINHVTTTALPSAAGLRGSRVEVQVLPAFTFAAKLDTTSRLQNQLMATQHSCLQEATVDRAASAISGAPLVAGYLEEAHSLLFTGTVSNTIPLRSHCDTELFEALAESSRHCELFMGPASRCSCFLTLFATLGSQCVGSLIFLHVCDHMAYCVDAQIADVCALVQPNVPLQVFAVVGGTALTIVVLVVLLKSKTILMVLRERSVRMHDNQQHVLSRQSATSMQVFSS